LSRTDADDSNWTQASRNSAATARESSAAILLNLIREDVIAGAQDQRIIRSTSRTRVARPRFDGVAVPD
jgi:hypothetical protein